MFQNATLFFRAIRSIGLGKLRKQRKKTKNIHLKNANVYHIRY